MADRYPIVVINGELKELPSGDTIPAAVVPSTFLGLTDTPSAYTSQALKAVRVNAGETALEFYTPSSGITIGSTAITSGTNDRILFQSGGVVSQSANLTFDGTKLTIGNTPISSPATGCVFIGSNSGGSRVSGTYQVGIGYNALAGALTADYILAIGAGAGQSLTSGSRNMFLGTNSGYLMDTGSYCCFIGGASGANFTGTGAVANTFIGEDCGRGGSGAGGDYNSGLGMSAMYSITSSTQSVAVGAYSAFSLTSGYHNTLIGSASGYALTSGNTHVLIGQRAGFSLTTETGCVFLGYQAGYNATSSNRLYIANSGTATPLIYGEFDTPLLRIHGNFYARRTSGAQITAEYDGSNKAELTVDSSGNLTVNVSGSKTTFSDAVEINGSLTLSAQNIVTDTTTGMKIGTGTTQKLGFFNATPVTQRANIGQLTDLTGGTIVTTLQDCDSGGTADPATINDNFAGVLSKINKLEAALKDLGFAA